MGVGGSLRVIATNPVCPQRQEKTRFKKKLRTNRTVRTSERAPRFCARVVLQFKYIKKQTNCAIPWTQRRDTPDQCSRYRFKTCHKTVHIVERFIYLFWWQLCAEESRGVATCRKCRVLRSSSGERHVLRWRENGLLCIVCQKWSLKVVKRHTRNAEPSEAYAAAEAERREQQKVKLCGVCLCILPQYSRVALSAHHTFHRGIVHSLSGGQAGRQEAAQAEDDRSEPVTRHACILHRNHYVHHSRTSLSLFPTLPDAKRLNEYKNKYSLGGDDAFLLGAPRRNAPLYSFPGSPGWMWSPVCGELRSPVARTPSSEEMRCKMGADLEADNPQALILLPCGRFPGNPFPVARDGAVGID